MVREEIGGKMKCADCKRELDCSREGECWSDNPHAFTHPHLGRILCRDCYANSHNFCLNCKDHPLDNVWSYCPFCGTRVT